MKNVVFQALHKPFVDWILMKMSVLNIIDRCVSQAFYWDVCHVHFLL